MLFKVPSCGKNLAPKMGVSTEIIKKILINYNVWYKEISHYKSIKFIIHTTKDLALERENHINLLMPLCRSSGLLPFLHPLSTHHPPSTPAQPSPEVQALPGLGPASQTGIRACCWHSASFPARRAGPSDKERPRDTAGTQMWRQRSKSECLT